MSVPFPRQLTRDRRNCGKDVAALVACKEDSKAVNKTPRDLPWKSQKAPNSSDFYPSESDEVSDIKTVTAKSSRGSKTIKSKYSTPEPTFDDDYDRASDIQSMASGQSVRGFRDSSSSSSSDHSSARSPSVTQSPNILRPPMPPTPENYEETPLRDNSVSQIRGNSVTPKPRILLRTETPASSKSTPPYRSLVRGTSTPNTARATSPVPTLVRSPGRPSPRRDTELSPTRTLTRTSSPVQSPASVRSLSPKRLTQSPLRSLQQSPDRAPMNLITKSDDTDESVDGSSTSDDEQSIPDVDVKLDAENDRVEDEQLDAEAYEGSEQIDRDIVDDDIIDADIVVDDVVVDEVVNPEDLPSPPSTLTQALPFKPFKDPHEEEYSKQGFIAMRTFHLYQRGTLGKSHYIVQMMTRYGDIIFVKFPKMIILGEERAERVPLNTTGPQLRCPSREFQNLMTAADVVTLFDGGLIYNGKIYSESQETVINIIAPYIYPLYQHDDSFDFEDLSFRARDFSAFLEKNLKDELDARKDFLVANLHRMIGMIESHHQQVSQIDFHRTQEANALYRVFGRNNRRGNPIPDPTDFHRIRHLTETMVRYTSAHLSLWCSLDEKFVDAGKIFDASAPVIYQQFQDDYPEIVTRQ